MGYTIPDNCFGCGECQPQCPTGAIISDEDHYAIDPTLCNGCEGYYPEPQCIVNCPSSIPVPLQAKKGRHKTKAGIPTSLDLFPDGQNNSIASSIAIWEACNILTSAEIIPWKTDLEGKLYYERPVQQGRGALVFRLLNSLVAANSFDHLRDISGVNNIDIRSACLHLLYAAYATTLDRPWEQEFVISDSQIEKYLGLDKRKDLNKTAKLTLIKDIAQQPCKLTTSIDWPQQGKVKGFSVTESPLWEMQEIQHHFQKDSQGYKHLVGLTFRVRAGLWAKYFLNKEGYKEREAFYQYGTLPKFLLNTVMTIWQQHKGAVRMMLWLLFKMKMGKEQRLTVPTVMQIAYGQEKFHQALSQREARKRLIRTFESDLEILNRYGIKPVFDPVTYKKEVQPLWARLADIPEEAEDAIEFWINDGNSEYQLTDSGFRGKWSLLMKARILRFDPPPEWEQQLAKFEAKKQQKSANRNKAKPKAEISADQILKARKKQGISQRVLAKMLGKSQSWIRDLEKGRLSANPEDSAILKKLLDLA